MNNRIFVLFCLVFFFVSCKSNILEEPGVSVTAVKVTDNAGFGARSGHKALVYDSKIWVIGGYVNGAGLRGDVYSSYDGADWVSVTVNAAFGKIQNMGSCVFNGKMWIIDGDKNSQPVDGVYSSVNGIDWETVTLNTGFQARSSFGCVVFKNKIWVIGGKNCSSSCAFLSDVWSTSDGITWNMETPDAGFGARAEFGILNVNDQKMYVICGQGNNTAYNDVWSSSDGVNWTKEADGTELAKRYSHSVLIYEGKFWALGGYERDYDGSIGIVLNESYSADGVKWDNAVLPANYEEKAKAAAVVFNGKMWILGGLDKFFDYSASVWSID